MTDHNNQPSVACTLALPARAMVPNRVSIWLEGVLLVFIASLPFESAWSAGDADAPLFSLSRITGIALLFACVATYRAFPVVIPRITFLYFAYLGAMLLACTANGGGFAQAALQQVFMLLQMLVLFCIVYSLCSMPAVFDHCITALGASITALAAVELVTTMGVGIMLNGRLSAFSEDPNTVGSVFAIGLIILAWRFMRSRSLFARVVCALCLPLVATGLVRSGARGALIAMAVGILVLLVPTAKAHASSKLLLLFALTSALLFTLQRSDLMMSRLGRSVNQNDTAYRGQIWGSAVEMFVEKPLLGWGPYANYTELGQRTGQGFADTHNLYLLVLTQTGLIGGVPYLLGLGASVIAALRARRDEVYGVTLALVVCVLVINSSLSWHNRKLHWVVMSMAIAAGAHKRFYVRTVANGTTTPCALHGQTA